MKLRVLKLFVLLIFAIFLAGCGKSTVSKILTVSDIHRTVVCKKTTVKDLKKWYGSPNKVIKNARKAKNLFSKLNESEDINYSLEQQTDYWDTVKVNKSSKLGRDFDSYYVYQDANLGVKKVYFFIVDDVVRSYRFEGPIANKTIAKKDKYLRQIVD